MRNSFKNAIKYFSPFEWALWLGGIAIIVVGFCLGTDKNALSLISSIFGISCIIFSAKGNVLGQGIAIVFAITYAILAYTKAYYGEMIIYLALMLPIHIASIVTWIKNSSKKKGKMPEVKVNNIRAKEFAIGGVVACGLMVGFYFLLKALNTDNLVISTISLITSLAAAYLMLRRCEYYNICFILNDLVLIALWSLKMSVDGISVLPTVLSFVIFLATDTYSFISWRRLKKRQEKEG
jgi:nicotinamide mononucleotide transporter PnuC